MTEKSRLIVSLFLSFALHWAFLHEWKPAEPEISYVDETIFVDISGPDVGISLAAPITLEQANLPSSKPAGNHTASRRKTALTAYLDKVSQSVHAHRHVTKSDKLIGNALFHIVINAQGEFTEVKQLRSSGDEKLDADALRAIKESSGSVRRPGILGMAPLSINLAVKYQFDL